jgi:signal transduction histidine kinase
VGIENARLFEQTEQRTRELQTLLEVARHVGSTLELRPLARRILDETGVVVDYDRSTFTLAVDGQLEVLAVRSAHGEADDSLLQQIGEKHPIGGPPLIWGPLLAGEPVIVEDTHAETALAEAYRQATGPAHVARSQGRCWMAVPLMTQGRLNGVMLMTKRTPGFFTRRHAELASAIASQAAVGIENARLFEQTEQRTRELSTVLDVSHAVASTLELGQLVSVILDELDLVTSYTGASLMVREGDDLVILDSRGHGVRETDAIGMRFAMPESGGWWHLVQSGDSVIIDDVRGDSADAEEYRRLLGADLESPAFAYVRSWLGVPLRNQDRVVGLLSMSRDEPACFTEQHARHALSIADQAALAIENARLYERVQTTAALEERQRLARELHDSVSQALYGIGLGARTAKAVLERDPERAKEPIEYVLSLAEAGLTEMRALIFELRPESLETEGLVAAIEKQVSATSARYGIDVDAQLCAEPDAPLDVKEAMYRIAQEALHNTVKHAHATAVELRLTCDDGAMVLHVHDNGSGFDPAGDFPGHLGLKSMRERMTRLRGTFDVDSAPGAGTRIHARVSC